MGWEGETFCKLFHTEKSFTLVEYSRRLVYSAECVIHRRFDCVLAANVSPPLPRDTINTRNARRIRAFKGQQNRVLKSVT